MRFSKMFERVGRNVGKDLNAKVYLLGFIKHYYFTYYDLMYVCIIDYINC